MALSASWGWSLLLPWNYALGNEVYFLTALWVAGLMAVLAYWSLLAGRAAIAIVPLTGVILLKVIPGLAGFPPAHWSEWMAALTGALVGALAARYASRAVDQADDPA